MATAAELTILLKAQNQTTSAIKGLQSDLTGLTASIKQVGAVAAGNILSKITSDAVSLGKTIITTGINFNALKEQAQIAFTTMLGSGEKATAFLNQLQAFAQKTPFEFPDLIKAAQRMQAMGFAAEEVIPTLTSVGDAVAAMGGGSAEIDRVTRALGQIQAKGRAQAEEMLQLTEAGIPAWRYLADAIGVSIPEAMKKVEQGAVGARTTIQAVTTGINKEFGGMMDQQSRTFSGMLSNLKDTFTQAAGSVLEPFFNIAKGFMDDLLQKSSNPALQGNLDSISLSFLNIANSIYKAAEQLERLFGILTSKSNILTDINNAVTGAAYDTNKFLNAATGGLVGLNRPDAADGGGLPVHLNPIEIEISRFLQRQNQAALGAAGEDPGFIFGEAVSNAKKKTDDWAGAMTTAKEKTLSLGDAFRSALDNIRSAGQSLFGTPTREQAGLNLNLDQAQMALNNVEYAARPMIDALNRASDAIDANRDRLRAQSDALSDSSFSLGLQSSALSDQASAIDAQIRGLRRQAERPKTRLERQIFALEGQKAGIEAQQRGVEMQQRNVSAAQHALDVQNRALDQQEKVIEAQKKAVEATIAIQQRQVDAVQRSIQQLDAEHKIKQDLLVLADQTLLTERQQDSMWRALLVKTEAFTGWLQQAADKVGISLIPGFDDAVNASTLFSNTLRDDVNPKMVTFGGLVQDVNGYLTTLRDQLSKPIQPNGSQAPYQEPPFYRMAG